MTSDQLQPLRIGVLGTSYWAWWCHATGLATHAGVDYVGLWGRDPGKAAEVAARVGGRAFGDLDDLLDSVDAVSIALPPHVQAPLAERAARAGKHLLLDKPLALDVPAADRVVQAARAAGTTTLSFMTFLFQPDVVEWLDRVQALAAEHGPWEGMAVNLAGSIEGPDNPYAASVWRREKGGLWDWGPHGLSVVLSLLPPVERVTAIRGMRDTVMVGLEHTGGPLSSLTLSVTAPQRALDCSLCLWGPGGRHGLTLSTQGLREAYHRAVDQFLEALRTGREHRLDAAHGRDIVTILDTAQRSLTRARAEPADLPTRLTRQL